MNLLTLELCLSISVTTFCNLSPDLQTSNLDSDRLRLCYHHLYYLKGLLLGVLAANVSGFAPTFHFRFQHSISGARRSSTTVSIATPKNFLACFFRHFLAIFGNCWNHTICAISHHTSSTSLRRNTKGTHGFGEKAHLSYCFLRHG